MARAVAHGVPRPRWGSETVYSSESSLRRPRELMGVLWRDLTASRELAWRLMVRDISAEYRQSLLGVAWAFLPPIALATAATLASRARVFNVGSTDIPYPAYVVLSTSLWQTFIEALNGPLQAIAAARSMLARLSFPREAIVLAKLGEILVRFFPKLLLIGALFVWFRIPVTWTALVAPLALVQLVLLGTLLGVFVAPLALLYHDFAKGLVLATGFWLLVTPVLYPVPGPGGFGTLVRLNPVTPLLVTARELATTGVVTQLPAFVAVTLATLVGLVLTWVAFRLALPFLIERVGS